VSHQPSFGEADGHNSQKYTNPMAGCRMQQAYNASERLNRRSGEEPQGRRPDKPCSPGNVTRSTSIEARKSASFVDTAEGRLGESGLTTHQTLVRG
jgi:hypothetical protein